MIKDRTERMVNQKGGMAFVMFIAWFGALVYFVNQASGFWQVLLAFLKACVWPAILLYHVLMALGA